MFRFITALAFVFTMAVAPLKADEGSVALEARFHAALNEVVQKVRNAKTPSEKRDILVKFTTGMDEKLEKAQGVVFLDYDDRAALRSVQKKFYAYESELNGANGMEPVADAKLDAFAGYIQQDMEQAPIGGGIYLSGGAIIIILLLIIILL